MDALPRLIRSSKLATTTTALSAIRQRIRIPRPLACVTPNVVASNRGNDRNARCGGNPFGLDDDQNLLGRGVVLDPETVDAKKSRRRDECTCGAWVGESNRRPVGTCWEAAVLPLNYTRSSRGFYVSPSSRPMPIFQLGAASTTTYGIDPIESNRDG